ncbi:helix-turn-helix transcriptional regulator [Planosporangium thailandense]|uniref:Helix-turn-helix transcriptional regulator n=1 Tax=Planosporangium thailandense TaxID=765197 RepID=A0ABX0XZH8_9ACTN|nr:helix-turn-helix domain-containing protein [Planosporangium thailandense]NJC70644.1 helix-turn-helix transcriptional regulator [Planosporangium thailandense]
MAESAKQRTLADKINHLFQTVHPASRGPYSNEEVATAIRDRGGPSISATYIWLLRRGERDNPTLKHLEALAAYFGVPAAYFFDDEATERIDAELSMLSAMRDAGVRALAMRMAGLSSRSLQPIADVIERVRELEGLQAADADASGEGTRP